ncbi:hypothetical protein PT974_00731 [Cladobotryum mycophilum]|uniref:Phosphoglycerate mutase n=1 Tax=Cladobotryum mycophilum TaxID=491253 RepID=A0ABR0T1R3_9HYPO
MVRPPSHIFVVRHGNRLDAADKQWHLTSPTPYDTPLTYGGFLQARSVGNHIGSLLEKAKIDAEVSKDGAVISGKPRRFRIVIHSSPFLRCVQTSVGISSGLAQMSSESIYHPSDVIIPRGVPNCQQFQFKTALLRIDSFLGEWLSPEYYECITPPPGSALMVGGAKAELIRRDDYSMYGESTPISHRQTMSSGALWNSSPSSSSTPGSSTRSPSSESDGAFNTSPMASALQAISQQKKSYVAPRPMYAVSTGGKIPEGLVAHARDACVMADYQWDSMREPLNFGDGGTFGEEWHSMHKRFRGGLKKLVNWYSTTEKPDELLPVQRSTESGAGDPIDADDEDVETVIIIVSHGAGCNALIGAVTHQPVLMDIGIASISMAVRKPNLDYSQALLQTRPQDPAAARLVPVDQMYEMRLSATTEHLRPTTSSSVSSRSVSGTNTWSPASNAGRRGRTATVGSTMGGPVLSPFFHREPFSPTDDRSISENATFESSIQRDSGSTWRPSTSSTNGFSSSSGNGFSSTHTPSGLWAPAPSSSSLMDDGNNYEAVDDYDSFLPDFDNKRFSNPPPAKKMGAILSETTDSFPNFAPAVQPPSFDLPRSFIPPEKPMLSAPIKLNTDFGLEHLAEEDSYGPFGGFGGWGLSPPPTEAERFHDFGYSKRRWTVNERV